MVLIPNLLPVLLQRTYHRQCIRILYTPMQHNCLLETPEDHRFDNHSVTFYKQRIVIITKPITLFTKKT